VTSEPLSPLGERGRGEGREPPEFLSQLEQRVCETRAYRRDRLQTPVNAPTSPLSRDALGAAHPSPSANYKLSPRGSPQRNTNGEPRGLKSKDSKVCTPRPPGHCHQEGDIRCRTPNLCVPCALCGEKITPHHPPPPNQAEPKGKIVETIPPNIGQLFKITCR
jgi:hypothetical protein